MPRSPESAIDVAKQYVKLTGTALSTQWKVSRAALDAAEAAIRTGRLTDAGKAYTDAARTQYGQYWREAAQLWLSTGQQLVELAREGGERVVQAVEGAGAEPEATDPAGAGPQAATPAGRPAARRRTPARPRRPRKSTGPADAGS